MNYENGNGDEQIEKYDIKLGNERTVFSQKERKRDKKRDNTWYYLSTFGEIGFGIAIPLVAGVAIGAEIDSRYGTYPRWTVGLLFFGMVVSVTYLIHIVRDILNDVKK